MESLTGLSIKGVCLDKVLDKHKVLSLSKKSEICFLGLSSFKIVHITSCSVQHKTIHPIFCASDSQIHTQSEETEITDTNQSKPVRVKFQLNKECSFGQHFYLVGDDPMLGLWDPSNAVPLEWSEGHVWNVELDIPSGKTISYKFIMTVDDETLLWQQGPDRIIQTWETKKTITVSEDWDNAELQTIVEEEPSAEQSTVSPAILIAENLLPQSVVDIEDDINEGKTNEVLAIVAENITEVNEDVNTGGNEDTIMEAKAIGNFSPEILIAENLVPQSVVDIEDDINEGKTNEVLAIVAENITEVNEDVNTGGNEDTTMEAKAIGKNMVASIDGVLSSKSESILVEDERVPVLVPGLTQVLTLEVHADKVVVESSLGSNSEELNEVHMEKVVAEGSVGSKSEEFNVTEEEVATDITHPPEKVKINVKQEVRRGHEDIEKSELVEGGGDWSNGKAMEENVFVSDMQRGKKTLLKFFAGLGFFKVELDG
ncbi:hypothetical protein H5410_044134 [Solanum commersonii]|uniref:CBM20 domain-containing protein n=1 Tax=Solanum commersonii TaxID=4109 RepID=A0A9J5X8Z5_SOLCO|nr:hypothetical protein H5410_044134 [Solanum commersonii]